MRAAPFAALVILLAAVAAAAGCGITPQPARGPSRAPDTGGATAWVGMTVYWPDASARLVPAGTDRLVVHVYQDGQELQGDGLPHTIARSPGVAEAHSLISGLPAGDVMLSVEALADESPGVPLASATYVPLRLEPGYNRAEFTLSSAVTAVELSPTQVDLAPGGTEVVTATACDAQGRTLVGLEFAFQAVNGGYFGLTSVTGSDNAVRLRGLAVGDGADLEAWPRNDPDPTHRASVPVRVTE